MPGARNSEYNQPWRFHLLGRMDRQKQNNVVHQVVMRIMEKQSCARERVVYGRYGLECYTEWVGRAWKVSKDWKLECGANEYLETG